MRVLLSSGSWQHKTNHNFSKRIYELYPDSKIAVFGSTSSLSFLRTLLLKDSDIKYEFFNVDDINLMKTDLDYDELRRFEENLPNKSLWHVIATNPKISSFSHGSADVGRKMFESRETIFSEFSERLQKMKVIFETFQPELYIESPGMDGWGAHIHQQICKERNISYHVLAETRVKNNFAFSDNIHYLFPQIEESYFELLDDYNENTDTYAEAKQLYDDLQNELKDPKYFDRQNRKFKFYSYDTPFSKIRWLFNLIYGIIRSILTAYKRPYRLIFQNITNHINSKIQHLRYTNPKTYDCINYSEKYLYYPLHSQPEYGMNVMGTMWQNQINTIELLSKSVPASWHVYVKEHPGVITDRIRPYNLLSKIKSFPNVKLVNIFEDMHKLISNAQMVAVVSGTSGFEAVQRGIPSISFVDTIWNVMGLSRKCANVETLSRDIHDELKRINSISPDIKKKRMICYLASILMHSTYLTYPIQYSYGAVGTDEEYEVCGREMADALVKHLDYLQKEKGYSF